MCLGIKDNFVLAAYLLCLGATALCVIYGIVNRNRGSEADRPGVSLPEPMPGSAG